MTPEDTRRLLPALEEIDGWFSNEAAMLFALLDAVQCSMGLSGDLFEIGAHHGKSTVVLASMAKRGQVLGVCDLFGQQQENASKSGSGDREIFESNIRKFVAAPPNMKVFETNSKLLTPESVDGGIRFFHIDGGHESDEALSDLRLAAATVVPNGLIVVDDVFRSEWPGVTEAVVRFLDSNHDFCAHLAAFNKLLICRRASAEAYARIVDPGLLADYGLGFPWFHKTLTFVGSPLHIIFLPSVFTHASPRAYLREASRLLTSLRAVVSPVVSRVRRVLT